jgi:hypothetical protein
VEAGGDELAGVDEPHDEEAQRADAGGGQAGEQQGEPTAASVSHPVPIGSELSASSYLTGRQMR